MSPEVGIICVGICVAVLIFLLGWVIAYLANDCMDDEIPINQCTVGRKRECYRGK